MILCLNPSCPKPENPDHHRFCQHCGWQIRLGDRFEALYAVGTGQNSRTFVGRDRATLVNAQCLIKRFTPAGNTRWERETATERFRKDVERLAIASRHPQIPDLLACFEQDDHLFLVQQFLVGAHLDQRLQAKMGPFDSDEVRAFLQNVLPILYHLHQNRLVHRDIKPQNFRQPTPQDHWWLVDLGAAKPLTATRMATPGTLVGSADYASPEQLRGEATFASDIYSLGVVGLHLLTGLQPFDLFDGVNGCWRWRSVTPTVSDALATVLDGMVQPALRDRISDVETVMAGLGMALPTPTTIAPTLAQPQSWRSQFTADLNTGVVDAVLLPRGDRLVVLTADDGLQVHSGVPALPLEATLIPTQPDLSAIAAHPHRPAFVTGNRRGGIEQWTLCDNIWQAAPIAAIAHGVSQLLFVADGSGWVAGDEQGTLHCWHPETAAPTAWQPHHAAKITALALSHNGKWLASGDSEGSVKLWHWQTGQCLRTLSRQRGGITALAWLADDQALVTAGWDMTVRWRCPQTGGILQSVTAQGFYLPVRSLLTHPTEAVVVTGSQDGWLQSWPFVPQSSGAASSYQTTLAAAVAVLQAIGSNPFFLAVTETGQVAQYPFEGKANQV